MLELSLGAQVGKLDSIQQNEIWREQFLGVKTAFKLPLYNY